MIKWLSYIAHFLHLAEKPLLSSAPPLCDDFQIKWSSYVRASEDRQCHSAILSYSEPMRFWSPASPVMDTHPCLEVEFKKNHVVTTVELRGEKYFCSVYSNAWTSMYMYIHVGVLPKSTLIYLYTVFATILAAKVMRCTFHRWCTRGKICQTSWRLVPERCLPVRSNLAQGQWKW